MQFVPRISLQRYLDVSIIIPLYNQLTEFKVLLNRNHPYFQRNGVEVIIVLCNPEDENDLLTILDEFPCINWIIIRHRPTSGRFNYCRALNDGIRQATNEYILCLEPQIGLITDIPYQLRYILKYYEAGYATNRVCTMADKKNIEAIGGYDERRERMEANEDMLNRLAFAGIKGMYVPQALSVQQTGNAIVEDKNENTGCNYFVETNSVETIFHWRYNKSPRFRKLLLDDFEMVWYPTSAVFEKEYPVICLMQVRNEIKHIPSVLRHLDKYCDGIILLDDGSNDGSFEQACSEKLVLKVKQNGCADFEDLKNRNRLLQLAHLFKADWFYFMDADERFDSRITVLPDVSAYRSFDSILFKLVHLWDNENTYRKDLPATSEGITYRYRMFRNKGFMQIVADRTLHFPACPFIMRENKGHGAVNNLVLHYGMMEAPARKKKYETYSRQDKEGKMQGFSYNYLLDTSCVLGRVEDLKK
jgi:glycosyltransferase involved in cell wall biosynthesis